jgi:hypothetical protein
MWQRRGVLDAVRRRHHGSPTRGCGRPRRRRDWRRKEAARDRQPPAGTAPLPRPESDDVLGFEIAVLVHLGHMVLGFYGFWLVWRVLLPVAARPAPTG